MERIIIEEVVGKFKKYLQEEERSEHTIEKYLCDLYKLKKYADGKEITKGLILEFMGRYDAKVKLYRVQRNAFAQEDRYLEKEEYKRLVNAARKNGMPDWL